MKAGTPGFQSPEQLNEKGISPKCDVYALGGVVTELFGGTPLWPKLGHVNIMYKVGVQGIFPCTSHLSPPIQQITNMCFVSVEKRANASDILFKLTLLNSSLDLM